MSEDLGRKEQTGESWSLTGRRFSWEWLMRSERGAFWSVGGQVEFIDSLLRKAGRAGS
jgi:hypothetical protein